MPPGLRILKEWFGYDRRERRASFILLVITVILLLIRYFYPGKNEDIRDITPSLLAIIDNDRSINGTPGFAFDPNRAGYDTMVLAGLTEKEARTVISYRNRGGVFRRPEDIRKIYGIDSSRAEALKPFINPSPAQYYQKQRKKFDLNRADSSMLESLPGIGPVLSVRILKYRNLLGGFISAEQLKEVYGLSRETYEIILPMVYADSSSVRKIPINEADYRELSRMPYLKRFQVADIIKFRETEGRISNIGELVKNKIIPDTVAFKIAPYLKF